MAYHNGAEFSTYDRDQDTDSAVNCPEEYHGAFWYKDCYKFNPNGNYGSSGANKEEDMAQSDWTTYESAQSWKMMFKQI